MITSQVQRICRSVRSPLIAATVAFLLPSIARAELGNNNPTGTSGVFNGNISTAGSYDPYTGNATRSVTDLVVAGSVGAYPLAFTRTMNSRYTPGAGTLEFGQAGTWRHNYQWSINTVTITSSMANRWTVMPNSYTVNYPDGRRVMFGSNSPYFRAFGLSDRFKQSSNPSASTDNCYLLLSDGGKAWFQVQIDRVDNEPVTGQMTVTSTFSFQFMGLIDPYNQVTTVTYPADGSMTITEPRGRFLKLFYITSPWGGGTVLDRVVASDGRSVKYNYGGYTTPNGTVYTFLGNVVYFGDSTIVAIYAYQNDNVNPNGRPLIQWAIDCMYNGPMWAIGYTFVPAASGGVYGQLQSENYLNPSNGIMGAAVSTLTTSGSSRTETRGDGPSRTFNYNGAWLANYTDFKGVSASIGYDSNGYENATIDQRQNRTDVAREPLTGRPTRITHPLTPPDTVRAAVQHEYGSTGCPDPYNRDGNNPYYLYRTTNERNQSITYLRDENKRVVQINYPNNAYETFAYNDFGQVYSHRMTSGGIEIMHLDGRGMMWASNNPDGTTYYYYDGNDRLEQVTDPRNNSTWFQYNARGQVTRVTHMDGTFVQFGYDNHGDRISVTDELNHTTNYVYDDYKRVLSVANPLDQTTSFNYAQDWVNSYVHTTSSVKGVFSPLKQTHFAYDENWRRTILRQAPGTPDDAWTFYGYDEVGNLTSVQDPRGNITSFAYDNRNRHISATNPAPFNNEITRWEYDAASNLTKEIRPDQSFRRAEYDSMNRVINAYGFAEERTQYVRDLAGNVLQMIDPKPATYSFEYDDLNRKTKATYPLDALNAVRSERWHYDAAGNLDEYTSVSGNKNTLQYDNRNRVWRSTWTWGGALTETTYDAASQVTSIETLETSVRYGYDKANRVIWEEQLLAGYPTRRIEKAPDADGNPTQLLVTTNGGVDYFLHYDYTQRSQLAHITQNDYSPLYTYAYDAAGNMTMRRGDILGDSTNVPSQYYDALNRPTFWEQTRGAGQWFARSHYQYDNLGREVATWREEQANKGEWFSYTASDQLQTAMFNADNVWTGNPSNASSQSNYIHRPDMLNWASVNGVPAANNALNQYTNINNQTPDYDIHFNLYRLGGFQYDHDAPNRLISVTGNGHSAQFTYDGLGRCVRRTVDGNTILFVYDGWKPVTEYDVNGNLHARNIYGPGPDELLMRGDWSHGWFFYHSDRRGSVSALVDLNGNVAEKYTYDAFGTPTVTNGDGTGARNYSTYGNRFMFTGREYIKELGIYDYRNRFYHPGIGRFIESDPIGFAGGDANLFRYCGGDPVNFSDPSGLQSFYKTPPRPLPQDAVNRHTFASGMASPSAIFNGHISRGLLGGRGFITTVRGFGGLSFAGVSFGGRSSGFNLGLVIQPESIGPAPSPVGDVTSGIVTWASNVGTAATMLGEFASNTGPQVRVFGPNSIQSADMRTDPMVWVKAAEAYASPTGQSTVRTFPFPLGPIRAGLHPIRQYVGSYTVEIRNGQAVVLNRTSLWSAFGHLNFVPTPDRSEIPYGGNTYQAYIIGSYP